MDKESVAKAFNKFEQEKYTDSEDIIRQEIKQSVNDHLKDKLNLRNDPIVKSGGSEEED